MPEARPVLLEPVMNVEVTAPEENMGDIMGDLSSRRGRPQGSESMGEMHAIRAQVPLAEMLSYAPQLRSMTGGRPASVRGSVPRGESHEPGCTGPRPADDDLAYEHFSVGAALLASGN